MKFTAVLLVLSLTGCMSVRQEDVDAWAGRPVAELDVHPVFLTMKMVQTVTPEGIEIRNYVNSKDMVSCGGGGTVTPGFKPPGYSAVAAPASYSSSAMCTSSTPTCNNLFYIKGGVVQRFSPVGSGGARCFTDERMRPGFSGLVNY
ncbi:hypothetical protein [Bradyrhizobium sp. CCBAU 21362]|uniref:hypothetical protein n=1 Tax=Bradyrhizobium sp. CCBAU 21362 TaxID=1325082 RepID=UPI0023056229|nr:hypothetical protein [Bradyrhizobium sp. CCBAU 21362]